jgi:hypothetical protein
LLMKLESNIWRQWCQSWLKTYNQSLWTTYR